jgi:4-alpha-glucanotransferase
VEGVRGARRSGILLHPTSLPGPGGIGDLGPEAIAFLDFLEETRQGLWQVLPLGPTGYGDSPYQCFSAFAGNPLLVSLDLLREEGLLGAAEVSGSPEGDVDYGAVQAEKPKQLRRAFEAFEKEATPARRDELVEFCRKEASWLDDFALFMAAKEAHGGASWSEWEPDLRERDAPALERARRELGVEVRRHQFLQFAFFRQWAAVRAAAAARGVRLLGDLPIFVAHDSADVWAHPEIFHLGRDGWPSHVAGVPPDYFSSTGQLWGNPLYRWDALARTGYRFWVERFRSALQLFDSVRLDHFRGFEAYWEVPAGEKTAVKGRWVPGPKAVLFETIERELGPLPVVAENLGVITPEVEALRERFGWPGMAILQFAFGADEHANEFLPHNHARRLVVYTGSHDNDTAVGWWRGGVGDTTRKPAEVERERAFARDYLGTDGEEIHWDLIRAAFASVAETAIVPLQDVLGLGSEARMNVPARASGNWRWRYRREQLTPALRKRLRRLTEIYGRGAPAARAGVVDGKGTGR